MTDSPQPKITTQWSTQISPIEQSQPSRQLPAFYPPSTVSPGIRHPLTRPLSPDLPTKDALYLFSNFASYMRSPPEGADGIRNSEDFRDTVRLLDYARNLASQSSSNVHVLHLKYRFSNTDADIKGSVYATGDHKRPPNFRDEGGRNRNPVPQPFSTLHDPVVKIDYNEQGVFDPLPAQAVFAHIAKACQPPPRIIVISYVCSKVTETHVASLSTWALTSSPPAYVFSPLETRLREKRALHLALHHAIPMSMYAWPADTSPWGSSPTHGLPNDRRASLSLIEERKTETDEAEHVTAHSLPAPAKKDPSHFHRGSVAIASGAQISFDPGDLDCDSEGETTTASAVPVKSSPPAKSGSWNSPEAAAIIPLPGSQERIYPPDPVATLTVITASAPDESEPVSQTLATLPPPHHPSHVLGAQPPSSASPEQRQPPLTPIQTRLDNMEQGARSPDAGSKKPPIAFAMSEQYDRIPLWTLAPGVGALHGPTSVSIGIRLSDFSAINLREKAATQGNADIAGEMQNLGAKSFSSIEAGIRTSPIALRGLSLGIEHIKRPESAVESERRKVPSIRPASTGDHGNGEDDLRIEVTPPDQKPVAPLPPSSLEAGGRAPSASWHAGATRVPGWKKGRKELMEDTIEELGKGLMGVDEEMMERVAQMALTPDKVPPRSKVGTALWACDWEESLMGAMT